MMSLPLTKTVTWHDRTIQDVYATLKSGAEGLSEEEAARRISEFGPNELQSSHRISAWSILLEQFKKVLIMILLIAAIISGVLGHGTEAIVITIIVFFSALLGFVQEYRAERAIEALRKMAAPTASVIRGNREREVPARELVPGDVVVLRAGDKVPADIRLTEAVNLQIEEAALTGESMPVEKSCSPIEGASIPVGDRRNMAHVGTSVTYGRGHGIVVATGMNTEFGKIAGMLQTVETAKTPLQKNLDKVGHSLARAAFVIVAIVVGIGLFRGQPFIEMLIFGIALAVAVVPEALPAVVTISLAIGVQRMVKRHALMRRLPAIETLGCTSVICSDKTGTLTQDEMTVRRIFSGGDMFEVDGAGYEPKGRFYLNGVLVEPSALLKRFLESSVLVSDAKLFQGEDQAWDIKGDPTEGALIVAAEKAGIKKTDLDQRYPRINEIPFTSESKRMTTLHSREQERFACSKGAPEIILAACSHQAVHVNGNEREIPLESSDREKILETARTMSDQALRVLAVARKKDTQIENAQQGMTFLGLAGMIDPLRPEVKSAVQKCEDAGIKVMMITGDHPVTAMAIARDLGLLRKGRVVTGPELDQMDDPSLEREAENIEVFARVSPSHKLRVVTALQKRDYVVAMTGDGVNDAPALKKADIGIAMGITGTDVAKEAAAMTLTDDNFASIVAAVEEGRGLYSNIKKYLMYLLSANVGEIVLIASASVAGMPLPLSAVQILYINLATDGLPALALAVDPPEKDLMKRPPRKARESIFSRSVVALMLLGGLWSAVINFSVFTWAQNIGYSLKEAMTLTFTTLILTEFFKAYGFRSDRHSFLNQLFSNKWLNLAILWEIILLIAIICVPFFNKAIGTTRLSLQEWMIAAALAFTILPVLEVGKWFIRRKSLAQG